jgi:hypothetical protein
MSGLTLPTAGVYEMHVRIEDPESNNVVQERKVRLRVVGPITAHAAPAAVPANSEQQQ